MAHISPVWALNQSTLISQSVLTGPQLSFLPQDNGVVFYCWNMITLFFMPLIWAEHLNWTKTLVDWMVMSVGLISLNVDDHNLSLGPQLEPLSWEQDGYNIDYLFSISFIHSVLTLCNMRCFSWFYDSSSFLCSQRLTQAAEIWSCLCASRNDRAYLILLIIFFYIASNKIIIASTAIIL